MTEPSPGARDAATAGLLAAAVFLAVFVVLTLVLLNLATPWISAADTTSQAASRLLLMLGPVLVVDATAGLAGGYLGGLSALRRGFGGRALLLLAVVPPVVAATALAAVGARDATQTLYDLLAIGGGALLGQVLAGRRVEARLAGGSAYGSPG